MSSIEDLLNKLDNLGVNSQAALEKGLRQAGKKIQGGAKLLVDVDTGRLRNSITEGISYEGNDIIEDIGTNLEYAAYVEFGTGPVGEASAKMLPEGVSLQYRSDGWVYSDGERFYYTEGQPADPFLYPAFKQNQNNVTDIVARALQKELREND